MALSTQPYKGARDFYPEDERLFKFMLKEMRRSAEQFGYEEYNAPLLEPIDLYRAKTGSEIINEQTYYFTDRGGREVVIRPEMTPSVSRMVAARRQELSYPLRWYSIPNLWRYERPQRGRLREHWQLNVDIFGIENIQAEVEIIQVANQVLVNFGAHSSMYEIKINSRRMMNYIFYEYFKFDDEELIYAISKLIDRMNKLSLNDFRDLLNEILNNAGLDLNIADQLIELLNSQNIESLPIVIQEHDSVKNLKKLLANLNSVGIFNARFDITIMRGFDYYTDIVFEIHDTHPENNRSMMGGGRYDGLVGLFGVSPIATVGFGLGDVALSNFLQIHDLMPKLPSETDIYVILIGEALTVANKPIKELREMGLNVAVDYTGRKIGDQIKTADKKNITYVLLIGQKELEEEVYQLKNLHSGVEERHSLARIVSIVKDWRQNQ